MTNRITLTLLIACFLAACQSEEPQKPQEPQGTEETQSNSHVERLYQFGSGKFIPKRSIRVYTPAGYGKEGIRYDVLYMQDGQMLFDATNTWNHQEWGVDEMMDSLQTQGLIRPTIVVGIDARGTGANAERIAEYCPDDIASLLPAGQQLYNGLVTPKGNDYLQFIVEELKPYIDSVYHTYPDREHTWIMGSSCGALISSYALCKYPNIFGGAACMSTHSTLAVNVDAPDLQATEAYVNYMEQTLTPNASRIYFDCGDQSLDAYYAESQELINGMLQSKGWDDAHFTYRFYPGHGHEEKYWKQRLDVPIKFLLTQ